MGPARSPMVLDTPNPRSAKADAHWLTACSLAPEQIIISTISQNSLLLASSFQLMRFSPSLIKGHRGTMLNAMATTVGRIAQISAIFRQFSMPNTQKNRVDTSTTIT